MAKKEEKDMQQPMMVSSHDIHLDADYAEWIAEVKHRYRSAQVKAAVKVNAEKLLWNWQMGRDLVQKKAEERWGAGVVEQVSLDLQKEFPKVEGFSASNLWRMKQWFLFYSSEPEKLARGVRELQTREDQDDTKLARGVREIIQRPVGDFPLPFALVPWGQHIEITTIGLLICSDMNKADVQWSFKGIQTPMGVATYNNIRIKDMLPTQEQLKERMELLRKEMQTTKRLMQKTKED